MERAVNGFVVGAWCARLPASLAVGWAALWLVGCGGHALSVSCGMGNHLDNGVCVVDVICGPGTTMIGNVCLSSGSDGGISCGAGTHLVGGNCVSDGDAGAGALSCGPGTRLVGGACLPAVDGGAACGPGTILVNGACVPAPSDGSTPITCGRGTHLAGGACVPDAVDAGPPPTIACGPGTHLEGDVCLPNPDAGGLPQFVVRVGVTTLGADGYSSVPVTVVGTAPDGSPSTDTVVLDTSRPGAGTVAPSTLKLTPTGATVYFTPCNAAASMWCPGTVHITLALASNPTTVLAESQEITLVAPTGVGSDAPCLAGGNIIFFNGDANDYIFNGIETITQGKWSADFSASNVHVSVWPTDSSQGLWWDLYFDSSQLGAPLTTQVYTKAERWPFESTGHPGLDVSGDGRGCNMVTGTFQIEDLTVSGGSLASFTATFEHHCEGGSAAVRGCVHYGQ